MPYFEARNKCAVFWEISSEKKITGASQHSKFQRNAQGKKIIGNFFPEDNETSKKREGVGSTVAEIGKEFEKFKEVTKMMLARTVVFYGTSSTLI